MITRKEIERLISDLKNYMYPNYFDNKQISKSYIKKELNTIFKKTNIQDYPEDDFLNELENIKKELEKDIEAFYEGDPASTSKEEIIITYPGFLAIMIYRIAHVLYKIKMAIVPRMMTEIAHSKTGIDIHPGATIFFHRSWYWCSYWGNLRNRMSCKNLPRCNSWSVIT